MCGFKLGLTAGLVIAMAMVASTDTPQPDEFNHIDAGGITSSIGSRQ
jgi:hypothetical protein